MYAHVSMVAYVRCYRHLCSFRRIWLVVQRVLHQSLCSNNPKQIFTLKFEKCYDRELLYHAENFMDCTHNLCSYSLMCIAPGGISERVIRRHIFGVWVSFFIWGCSMLAHTLVLLWSVAPAAPRCVSYGHMRLKCCLFVESVYTVHWVFKTRYITIELWLLSPWVVSCALVIGASFSVFRSCQVYATYNWRYWSHALTLSAMIFSISVSEHYVGTFYSEVIQHMASWLQHGVLPMQASVRLRHITLETKQQFCKISTISELRHSVSNVPSMRINVCADLWLVLFVGGLKRGRCPAAA